MGRAPQGGDAALFIAMPARHLRSATASGPEGPIALPLGRLGDLPRAPVGCPVYVVALDDDGIASAAATWRASLRRWWEPSTEPTEQEAARLPPTWLEERRAAEPTAVEDAGAERTGPSTGAGAAPAFLADDEDEDDEDDEDGIDEDDLDHDRPRQVFLEVEDLVQLPPRERVFTNEVVPKQRRGARSFVPMAPTLVRLPD
jgi:hypothetical protein